MTISDFARTVIEDPAYRESVIARAKAGTLPVEVEMLLLESFEMGAGGTLPAARRSELPQSRTLALIRPPAPTTEEAQ
jgi:hypothetical protein